LFLDETKKILLDYYTQLHMALDYSWALLLQYQWLVFMNFV